MKSLLQIFGSMSVIAAIFLASPTSAFAGRYIHYYVPIAGTEGFKNTNFPYIEREIPEFGYRYTLLLPGRAQAGGLFDSREAWPTHRFMFRIWEKGETGNPSNPITVMKNVAVKLKINRLEFINPKTAKPIEVFYNVPENVSQDLNEDDLNPLVAGFEIDHFMFNLRLAHHKEVEQLILKYDILVTLPDGRTTNLKDELVLNGKKIFIPRLS